MIELVYVSRAKSRFDQQQLNNLLKICRKNNHQHNITGLLLYDGYGTFIQALEGPQAAIEQLFDTIKTDSRHTNINKIGYRHITTRGFPDWQMGFKLFSQAPSDNISGYSDFMNNDKTTFNDKAQNFAMKMLHHFRDSQ